MILPERTARKEAGVSPLRQDLFLCPFEERDDCICLQTTFSSDDKQAHSWETWTVAQSLPQE